VESAAWKSPPVTAAKLAADHIRGAALEGAPQTVSLVRRREYAGENSA
jgi:hypothetical protein